MAQQEVYEILNKIAKQEQFNNYKISINLLSTDGANFSSNLFVAKISASDKELNLFVKVAAIGEKLRTLAPVCIYKTEVQFYTKIFKLYNDIESKHHVPDDHKLVLPRLYGFQTMDWDYASHSLTALAKLHGLSMAYAIEYPDEFKKDGEVMKIQENIDGLREYLESAITKVLQVTKAENKEQLKKFLDGVTSVDYFMGVLKPMRSCVLTHADYRPSNLLHKVQDGKTTKVIPIDFQTIRHGNLVSDLVYFIFTGSNQEFRNTNYQQCLDHYYSELSSTLTRLHLDPNQIYSRKDFEYELEQASSYGLLSAILCLLIITVDPKDAPKVDDKLEQKDFAVIPNERYSERINGVIEDFIKLGVI
ncbi:uncharacterized protein LOC123715018 isoform X2 [Pieris brassicae]|uniref:uncharacterized protein LOC123715018 isoform X2 n=1 Tax=Pieris brassicae TaxID=7116 RepID=UPI001E65E5DA|nr:uncharacterized protein LOC123715018 isoform X2 [Pieris brassicae]